MEAPRWLVRLSLATTALAYAVICAGGNVKSKEAGLAVPDWPLSYGLPSPWVVIALAAVVAASIVWLLRAFRGRAGRAGSVALLCASGALLLIYLVQSPDRWIQIENLRAEHGHRLLAGALGICMLALALAVMRFETRRPIRWLALVAFLGVVAQAILGGVTVHLFLKVSVYHAVLAQVVFGMLVATTALMSRGEAAATVSSSSLSILAPVLTLAIYVQIVLGALVRHFDAAMAMPGFPLPLFPESLTGGAILQMSHRMGALVVLGLAIWGAVVALRRHRAEPRVLKPAVGIAALVLAQILLGGAIVWTWDEGRLDHMATLHVAVGTLIVAASLVLSLECRMRVRQKRDMEMSRF
jgi:heme A synthase